MNTDEARQLLLELRRHAVQHCFQVRCKAERGDILIWDNFAVMHRATPLGSATDRSTARLLYRISTRGLPALVGGRAE